MAKEFHGRPVVPGAASAIALVSQEPLSFWGGYDQHTGEIIDRRHHLSGQIAAGKVFVLPFSKGSSTTTAVLLEAIKAGKAPAAIITTGTDTFFALASIVADEMYQTPIPIIALNQEEVAQIETGDSVEISVEGIVKVSA
jgi:predicted aconitase with swiveling domain